MAEYVKIYERYPERRAEMIEHRALVMFNLGLTVKHRYFLKETCEAIGATEEQFKDWYYERGDPTQEQAERLSNGLLIFMIRLKRNQTLFWWLGY